MTIRKQYPDYGDALREGYPDAPTFLVMALVGPGHSVGMRIQAPIDRVFDIALIRCHATCIDPIALEAQPA